MDTYIGVPAVTVREKRVREVCAQFGFTFFALEECDKEGGEHHALVHDCLLARKHLNVAQIVRDLTGALAALHNAGYVHGAVNKHNVLVDFNSSNARLLPHHTMQRRRFAKRGELPLGSGQDVTSVAPVHFTGAEMWDTALEDLWSLGVLALQMLDVEGELNAHLSPVPRLLFLAKYFHHPRQEVVRAAFSAALSLPQAFASLLQSWWRAPHALSLASACDFADCFSGLSEASAQVCVMPPAVEEHPEGNGVVWQFARDELDLKCLNAQEAIERVRTLTLHFGDSLLLQVVTVLLCIKRCLLIHFKRAERACASISRKFLDASDVPRVFALESWVLAQ